ncbi:MAG: hypothetical protein ACP5GJ_01080 [Nanopusillaceae archaeon]
MSPQVSSYKLLDKNTVRTLEDISDIFDDYPYSIIGGIAVAIYSYLSNTKYYQDRSTFDI